MLQRGAMAQILYTAITTDGREVTDFVDASSLSEADSALRARGLRAVRFHSDPALGSAPTKHGAKKGLALQRGGLRPLDVAKIAVWIVFLCWGTWQLGAWMLATLGLSPRWAWAPTLVVMLAYVLLFQVPVLLYPAVRRAMTWGDYRRALALVRPLRILVALGPARSARHLFDIEEACILAGLGRLDEAHARMVPLRDGTPPLRDLYDRNVMRLASHARDFDELLRLQRRAAELHPDEAMPWIDVALTLALRFEDLAGAREALAHASGPPTTEVVRAGAQFVESLCRLGESDVPGALLQLDAAVAGLGGAMPGDLSAGWLALCEWQRASCLAAQGDVEGAERALRAATPILLAGRDHALVERARRAVERARAKAGEPH